ALQSDQGAAFDGLAIDDIHVYDLNYPLFDGDAASTPLELTLAAQEQQEVVRNGEILAAIETGSNTPGRTAFESYRHQHFMNKDSSQYFIPRSFLIQPEHRPADSFTYRLYVPDEDVQRLRNAEDCASCS